VSTSSSSSSSSSYARRRVKAVVIVVSSHTAASGHKLHTQVLQSDSTSTTHVHEMKVQCLSFDKNTHTHTHTTFLKLASCVQVPESGDTRSHTLGNCVFRVATIKLAMFKKIFPKNINTSCLSATFSKKGDGYFSNFSGFLPKRQLFFG